MLQQFNSENPDVQALMALLATLEDAQGEEVNPMSEAANQALMPYVVGSQVIPAAVPMIKQILDNIKTAGPLYVEVRDFLRKEITESVLIAFKQSLIITNGDQAVALELTKLIMRQNDRVGEVLSKNIQNVQKEINGDK